MNQVTKILSLLIMLSVSRLGTSQIRMEAFKDKNFTEIQSMLLSDVTVKIDSNKKIEGNAESMAAIKKTLNSFSPIKMEMKHKGTSAKNEDNYMIAKFFNAQNETLRVFIHLENTSGGKKICDLRIRHS